MTPVHVRSVQQKCRNDVCGKWFNIGRAFISKLESDFRSGQRYNRVVLCSHCFTEQMLHQIGEHDQPDLPLEQCKVQHIILHTVESLQQYEGESLTKGANRASLVEHRNALLRARGIPTPTVDTHPTKEELAKVIHELENPPTGEPAEAPTPPTRGDLLKRLNVIRTKQSKPVLKSWKASHDALIAAVADAEADRSHVEVTVGKTKIAKGANVTRFDTAMHKNKLIPKVTKISKDERTAAILAEKDEKTAARAAKRVTAPMPDKVTTPKVTKPVGNFLTPSDLATALKADARHVRGVLRKDEAKIPKTWRVEGVRWGFAKKHEKDILALVKAGLK